MKPLAVQLRPDNLDDFIGQKHLVGPNKPLRKMVEEGKIFSMIFWGPPGVGKTTLARIIAHQQQREFFEMSAVSAGKNDVRQVIESTHQQKKLIESYKAPVLFLDEIHRFNKAQQDFLLPYVEEGTIILIGATTENPSFEVISPLLSRVRVFVLKELAKDQLLLLIKRVEKHLETKISTQAQDWLVNYANGDARLLLTIVDNTYELYENLKLESLKRALQSQHLRFDKQGEEHYNTISAFIKSMRASDVDAALYYLARMVKAGEKPEFIARRMVIFASEDIGLAQPTALVVANAVFDAVHKVGYPEAQINLAHGAAYLTQAKKDRSAYNAYFSALADVEQLGNLPIPLKIRNAPTDLMKKEGYGEGYELYTEESLLPKQIKNKKYLKAKKERSKWNYKTKLCL